MRIEEPLLSRLSPLRFKRTLDVGCGYGRITSYLKIIWPGAEVIGSTVANWAEKIVKGKLARLKVEADILDNIVLSKIPSLDHVKLLKVDVEGAEVEVLKGATKILKLTDYIVFEASKQTIEGCLGILSGFNVKFIEESGPTFNFIATRRGRH